MASKAVKTPILKAVTSRNYCTGKANPICGTVNSIKATVLPNNLVVASADNGSPLARVSVVFKAGSRYETTENLGAAHMIRVAAGLSTVNSTNFAITRNIQQAGANLTCIQGRETLAYTLEGTYIGVEKSSEYLSDIVSQQCFKPWELSDIVPRIKYELATRSFEAKAIDLLHKAAFRSGLGNSLYIPKHKVGKLSTETLLHYVSQNLTGNRAAVVGLGVDHENLVQYATNMNLPCVNSDEPLSKYYGGEVRLDKGGDLAYVAVGGMGAALSNPNDTLAFAILRRIMGTGPYVQYGNESTSLLSRAVAGDIGDSPFTISGLNATYTDTGLFGFLLVTSAAKAGAAVTKAVHALKNAQITQADVDRAKRQLITSIYLKSESGSSFIDFMGTQACILKQASTPEQLATSVSQLSVSDVQKAAQTVAKSKLSMASVGNLSNVPYLEDLK